MIVGDEQCPSCAANGGDRTGNHLMVFEDGNKHCNRCNYTEIGGSPKANDDDDDGYEMAGELSIHEVQSLPTFGIPHKRLNSKVSKHYGVRTEFNDKGEPSCFFYPVYKHGEITGYKKKTTEKIFTVIGDGKDPQLFGQNQVKPGGNLLIITEGEDDAMAIWQTLYDTSNLEGWLPPVVSLPTGAGGAVKALASALEYVQSFEKIILCFDQDEVGQEAIQKVAPLLPQGKLYIAKLAEKDANEMIIKGKADELKWDVLKHYTRYQPDGIVAGADTWDRYKSASSVDCIPYPEDWIEANKKTYGFRYGSVVTVTAGTSVGKTQLLRELKYHLWSSTEIRIADISLEEDVGDSVAGLMGLHAGKRIHLPDVHVDEQEERQLHNELFGDDRFSFYDHFGGMDDSSLLNKIRYYGVTGHKVIFLDHLSIIVSEFAAEGDERQRIDTIMTRLAKLAKELEVTIFIVVHLRKEGFGRSFEEGTVPTLDDLRGSGSLKQLSWDVLALSRNSQHPDPKCKNTSLLTVLKCRFTGNTGACDYLNYNEETGRMKAIAKPTGYELKKEL